MVEKLALVLGILAALTVLTEKLAAFFRARGNTKLADDLNVAHELLYCVTRTLDSHEHGESVFAAISDATKSPEAQDLLGRVIAKKGA